MTAAFRFALLIVVAFLPACASETKQPAQSSSSTGQAESAPPSSTPPGSTQTTSPPAAAPPAATPSQPAPSAPRPEAPPSATSDAPHHVEVSVGRANVREKPDTKSRILQVLSKGTKLTVVGKGNQWYRVRLANGTEGWIAESVVTPVRGQ
jgi:uncharacterized protein YgiM (DUF1202 family)